jgi:alkylated DNA nucleotide flippase Atl1
MRSRTRKSWQEKLANDKGLPKVVKIEGRMSTRWGTGTVAIPAPREVDALMRQVPKGKVTTINHLREAVARKHHATIGCPITTGIFAWVAAHAAEEAASEGKKDVTPWWRTLKSNGELNEKYPGGAANQARLLKAEGHALLPGRGKKPPQVKGFEKHLEDIG